MAKRVLDVGNCAPDHAAIRTMIEGRFTADVVQAHGLEDALQTLLGGRFDLVLINRKLDRDDSDGLAVVRAVKADPRLNRIPVMMVTNYDEHQQAAVAAGAEYGFGKLELSDPATIDKLRPFLA